MDDDELADLADTSISNVTLPEPRPTRSGNDKNTTQSHTSVSPVHVLPPPSDGTTAVHSKNKLPSRGSSGPTAAGLQSVPSTKKSATSISKEELEVSVYQCQHDDRSVEI